MAKNSRNSSEFHGIVLVDKPAGITSHDVVDRIRRIFGTRSVGHTGTLDPQATGLLVLMLGEATKISEYLVGMDKSYEGTMQFGVVSDTYDSAGKIEPGAGGPIPTDMEDIQELAHDFIGEIDQVPPPYSAKKHKGKKLYEYARQGDRPEVAARKVTIGDFEILTLEGDRCEFGVDCSAGTYIRSIAHELGETAGCGALLTELRRTDVGPFTIENAHTLGALEEMSSDPVALRKCVAPIRTALAHMPILHLGPGAEKWVRSGQAIPHNMVHGEDDHAPRRGSLTLLCRMNGVAVAVARVDPMPISPPPHAIVQPVPPWFQPIKQFVIAESDLEDDEDDDSSVGNV